MQPANISDMLPVTLSDMHPATILVVEDEAIVAMDLSFQLQEMGYQVCGTADNGKDAIALAWQHRPSLVLMDIVIKGDMDGVDTARHIGRGLHIPVIFLTAYSDARTVERAAKAAPYGYLTKPFQPKELRAAIEVALYKATVEQRLRESEQWFSTTLRCVADSVIATDPEGMIRFINPAAELITGWSSEEAIGRNVDEVLLLQQKGTGAKVESPVRRAMKDNSVVGVDYGTELAARDGTLRPVDNSAAPIRGDDGRVLGAVVVFRDVGERLKAEELLRNSEERFRNAFDFAPVGMALVALDGRFLQANGAICSLLGKDETELAELTQMDVTHPGDIGMERDLLTQILTGETPAVQFEKRYRLKGGADICVLVSISLLRQDDEPRCYLYQVHDLSVRKAAEYQLARLAHFDALTGLANRTRLRDEADGMLARAHRQGQRLAVVFLDIDNFKQVNDSLGHDAGDRLLQSVAQRLKACVRETDCVARLGGDEFVVMLSDIINPEDVSVVTEKVRMALSEPFDLEGQEVPVSSSLGVSVYPDDAIDLQKLFRCADSALYHAKAEGRNNVQFYRPELTARVEARVNLQSSLHRALERGEFVLHYQPLVALPDGKAIGAEALLRWQHPARGLIPPDAFIPIAEDTGLIVELGEWVLHEACLEAVRWQKAGKPLTVSVNVSARQFKAGTLVEAVQRALASAKLEPGRLCLEITEQIALHNTEHNLAILEELKALGVAIAIDDFGVGYSSLSYLKRFGPHSLKIDRTFVRDLANDPDDAAIVSAVIAMAKRLKIRVVAEGVENEDQRAFLTAEGCEEAQGYLYARPCPAEEFHEWLTRE